jgi:mgtE-like transporter
VTRVPRPHLRRPAPPPLPVPVARVLRLLGLPVAEVSAYWRQERPSLQRGATALVIGLVATLIAGLVLGAGREQLERYPGLLVLIPAAIGMRGSIFGSLAARISTAILTGEFQPQVRRGNYLGRQIAAAGLLTVTTSVLAGVLAWVIGSVLDLPLISLLDLVAVSLVAGVLSSLALLAVTIQIARQSEARGWNMDDVGAPTITATGDLITLPALLLATLLLRVQLLGAVIGAVGVAAGLYAGWRGWRAEDPSIRRVIRESLVVLTIAVTVDVLAGLVMESRADELLGNPALLVLIPPFIANSGSLGGMLASRLGSKLHVGLLQPRTLPGKLAGLDISIIFALAAVAFTGVGAVGWVAARLAGLDPPGIVALVGVTLLGGFFATLILAVVAYTTATATFRFGLDPDNHGIPIVTAAMDLLGILCLVGAIALLRVG